MTLATSVMVVDDDRDIREIVEEILLDAAYSVLTARNGAEALATLKGSLPRLILLDLNMPIMDGIAFRHEQRRDPRIATIPTVVMSAVDQMEAMTRDLGFAGALAKPVQLKELLRVVRHHCGAPRT